MKRRGFLGAILGLFGLGAAKATERDGAYWCRQAWFTGVNLHPEKLNKKELESFYGQIIGQVGEIEQRGMLKPDRERSFAEQLPPVPKGFRRTHWKVDPVGADSGWFAFWTRDVCDFVEV